jgi:hypothetical protein
VFEIEHLNKCEEIHLLLPTHSPSLFSFIDVPVLNLSFIFNRMNDLKGENNMVDEVCVSAVYCFVECLRSLSQPATKGYVIIKGIAGRDFFH